MSDAFITAIIPTYKRPVLLKRAVGSVLAQTFPDFEILIADNASGEQTDAVIEMFLKKDSRIKVLKHASNIGAIANFNAALMQTTTPYVCFLPDDDFFTPIFFEEALPYFTKYPEIAFCGGGGYIINKEYYIKTIASKNQIAPPSGYYPPPSGLLAYLRSSFGIAFPPLLFKTEIVKKIGGFDVRIRNGIDEHLVSQCCARYPVYLLTHRPFYFGFEHEGSLSGKIDYPLFEKEAVLLHENLQHIAFSASDKEEIDLFFQKRRLKILANALRDCILKRNFNSAKEYASKLVEIDPCKKWKRKKMETSFFSKFPFLFSALSSIKKWEHKIRTLKKRKRAATQDPTQHIPPDAPYWMQYIQDLESHL